MAELNWDHTMINVIDLEQAIKQLGERGIVFKFGGDHKQWGTTNALGYFGINYIELLSVNNSEVAQQVKRSEGASVFDAIQDYQSNQERFNTIAIRTTDIEETHQRLAKIGIKVGPVEVGQRLDPTGKLIKWLIFFIDDYFEGLPYPFVIQWAGTDETRAAELTANGLITAHPAGDLKVQQAIFEVNNPKKVAELWGNIVDKNVDVVANDFMIDLNERQLIFTAGSANHLVALRFTGAKDSLKGQTVKLGNAKLIF